MSAFSNLWQSISNGFDMMASIIKSARGDPDAWESSIRKFEAQDKIRFPTPGMILFVGSSSFTFWSSMEADLSPLPVLNRGFGGAMIGDVVHYVERIVLPYCPRAVVLFAGTNDISGPNPATVRQVFDAYRAFVQCVHSSLPDVPIYYIAITPAPLRWKYWGIADAANCAIQEFTETDPRLHFIDLTDQLLTPDGKPDRSLYRFDRLHPNKKGYAKWTAVIKPLLMADLN
jgi:lysophospholipase L1-like esterase